MTTDLVPLVFNVVNDIVNNAHTVLLADTLLNFIFGCTFYLFGHHKLTMRSVLSGAVALGVPGARGRDL